jgi:hypothetical protein
MKNAGFDHVSSLSLASVASICGLIWAASLAPAPAFAQGTPEQQQACQPDAMRLCSEFVPNVEQITACMTKKKALLSPECKAVFGPPRRHKAN